MTASDSAKTDLQQLEGPWPGWFEQALDVPRREHWIDVDGVSLHGFSWGDPGKPAVLFTHGMMAHARCWAFVAPLLAEHYHLAAFDLSGMGDSGWRDSYSFEERAAGALGFAKALDMQRPALVCHSFGGSVGLAALEANPEAWRSLIVCDMTMLRPEDLEDFESNRVRRPVAEQPRENRVYESFASARARFRLAPEQPCANTYLVDYMAYHSLRQLDGGWQWKFDPKVLAPDGSRNSDWWLSIPHRFVALDVPKAIIHGELSLLYRPHTTAYLRSLASTPLPIVPLIGAHHHVMLDQPLALAAALEALLQAL